MSKTGTAILAAIMGALTAAILAGFMLLTRGTESATVAMATWPVH